MVDVAMLVVHTDVLAVAERVGQARAFPNSIQGKLVLGGISRCLLASPWICVLWAGEV